jgi:hypothetical protein
MICRRGNALAGLSPCTTSVFLILVLAPTINGTDDDRKHTVDLRLPALVD